MTCLKLGLVVLINVYMYMLQNVGINLFSIPRLSARSPSGHVIRNEVLQTKKSTSITPFEKNMSWLKVLYLAPVEEQGM